MKKYVVAITLIGILYGLHNSVTAGTADSDTLRIQTSAECNMCKMRIEKEMAFEKGVKSSNLNLDDMVLMVIYNSKKTDPETIKKRISLTGYDADGIPADPKAYDKLPDCCKKGGHDHEDH